MNVLLIGSGGREHALAWAISRSPKLTRLYCAPGNAGIGAVAELVPLDPADHRTVIRFAREKQIDLVVIGPEAPLVAGLADDLRAEGVATFGPSAAAARLEGSKRFTKDICRDYSIPTAAYESFTEANAAKAFVARTGVPIVIKADGLAAGKGVVIAETREEADAAIDGILGGAFGDAGTSIVVEQFLTGEEASFFALCDGDRALALASAQDHKRAFDGDTGPNTGGMGAYSPAPVLNEAMSARVMEEIIEPTLKAMRDKGCPFSGVLFAGLMINAEGPKLIEYNVRFGDPECQVLMMRLKSDLLALLKASAEGDLAGSNAEWHAETALTVVMAARGYPGAYERNTEIGGLDAIDEPDVKIFHAGTVERDGRLLASGGRVLNVTALGRSVTEAQHRAYNAVDRIDWPGGFCRRDIGWRAIERERVAR
ncbi:MAG: phosphoribosylamine--glycine ligase [Flavobacteriaceae bacterium]